MPGGQRSIVINTQERAISPDINRLQAFAAREESEAWRHALDAYANDDLDAGGVATLPAALENPLRAEVLGGLLVRPQSGSFDLFVDAGLLKALAPDGDTDASPYKHVRDPGIGTAGVLTMSTNGGGSPRIDVIECRINPTDDLATDSRDIFNPSTGLFTATTVVKERAARLEYRVRTGTAGGGFAAVGTASGWLPLCVASVPAGAASNDAIAFWDVRPMVADRIFQPHARTLSRPKLRYAELSAVTIAATTGIVEADVGGYRLGGRLRSGVPNADADSIDLTNATNQEPGIVFTASSAWYLYLLTPFGLPRWARYTTSGTRLPRSPRGIPVVSMVKPTPDGVPSAAVSLPTACGLGGSTSAGYACAAGANTSGGAQFGFYGGDQEGVILQSPITVNGSSLGFTPPAVRYDFTAGTHYPTHARALLVEFNFSAHYAGVQSLPLSIEVHVFIPGTGTTFTTYVDSRITPGATDVDVKRAIWLDLPSVYPSTAVGTVQRFDVYLQPNNGNANPTLMTARVVGWRL